MNESMNWLYSSMDRPKSPAANVERLTTEKVPKLVTVTNRCKVRVMLNTDVTADIREYPAGVLRHRHDYTQIIIPIAGAMRIKIEGSYGIVSSNKLAVVPDFHAHEFEVNPKGKFLVLDWRIAQGAEGEFQRILNNNDKKLVNISRFWSKFFRFIAEEMFLEPNRSNEHTAAILVALRTIEPIEEEIPTVSPKVAKIEKVVQRIRSNEIKIGGMSGIAKEMAMSQSQFYSEFRKWTGYSPKQLEIKNALDIAADRLACSDSDISRIAHQAGYENLASFTRIFKKHYGLSPSQYRVHIRSPDRAKGRSSS